MHVVRRHTLAALALCTLAVSGCGRKKEPAPQQAAGLISRAVQVAEDQIRTDAKVPGVRFRGVMPWTQALPNHVAVCGQAAVFGANSDTFVPFVSVLAYAPDASPASLRVEHEEVGSTVDGAGKAYLAMLDTCWEKGGPKPGPVQAAASLPPVPNNLPDPAVPRAASQAPGAPPSAASASAAPGGAPPVAAGPAPGGDAVADQTPASGDVSMRQNGNLHASPHGPTLRVVQQGTAMKVFAQAPGGWYQVGTTEPWGWIHSSMLDKR